MSYSPTSSPCRSRSHSTTTSLTNPSSKRAFSAAASPRAMPQRGKRARRGSSPSSRPPSITIPIVFSSGPFSALSTAKPLAAIPTNLACSAPSTPLFPSTSAAFFPSSRSSGSNAPVDTDIQTSPLPSSRNPQTLNALHQEAFTSLRQSVAESGEGFVRRMREWEQRRHLQSSKAPILGNEKERDKRRDRYGGRKARGIRINQRAVGGSTRTDYRLPPADRYHRGAKIRGIAQCTPVYDAQDGTDDENDIMMNDTGNAFTTGSPQKKGRPVSLGDVAMDVADSPELFDVEIADSDGETYPASHFNSAYEFPFTYSNTRSSSPFSLNTSDDESSSCSRHEPTHSGLSSPRGLHHTVEYGVSPPTSGLQHLTASITLNSESSGQFSPGPPSSTIFPSSSSTHFRGIQVTSTDSDSMVSPAGLPQTTSEKALAALALALANGSGSLTDYRPVREAQGDLADLEAGGLWE